MTYKPDSEKYPVTGIDVSHHQGEIDWKTIATQNIQFAYIKSTEGGDWKDKRFQTNWTEAGNAGIKRGAYHFFTFCRPGKDQAQNYINSVPVDENSLPPAVDLEFGGNCKVKKTRAELVADIEIFLTLIEEKYKKKPVIYVTPEFYQEFKNQPILKFYPLWVRSILQEPDYADKNWIIWQYHNRGKLDGIDGPVDLNVFRKQTLKFEE